MTNFIYIRSSLDIRKCYVAAQYRYAYNFELHQDQTFSVGEDNDMKSKIFKSRFG